MSDLIKREDAIKAVDELYNSERHLSEYEMGENAMNEGIQALLEDIPAVEPKQGEWIQHYETTSDGETLPYGWECSVCGRWEIDKEPYCNCGARMQTHDLRTDTHGVCYNEDDKEVYQTERRQQ